MNGENNRRRLSIVRRELSRDEALKLFKEYNEDYKVELINDCRMMP